MAASPKDVREQQRITYEKDMDHWEGIIDNYLMCSKPGEKVIRVSIDEIPSFLQEELLRRFRSAGWTITPITSHRSPYWIFTENQDGR